MLSNQTSPIYSLSQNYNGIIKTSFYYSRFLYLFTNVVVSYNIKHQTLFKNSLFSNLLNTPLKFVTEYDCGIDSSKSNVQMPIFNKTIAVSNFSDSWLNKRAYFLSECGNISIYYCTFIKCYSLDQNGGSLLVAQDCSVIIYGTQFIDSHTVMNHGGCCCIVKQFNEYDDILIKDEQIQSLNIQYCCFSGCYPETDNNKLFGLALFCASKKTVIYLSSTVNCPPEDKSFLSGGAQIDIQADQVKSKNVNVTGGMAKYCAAIEIRYATMGFYKFQTISNIKECMFASSFYNATDMELSFSNYDNISFVNNAEEKDVNLRPGSIYIWNRDIVINNFAFTNFIDMNSVNPLIVSRGTYYVKEDSNEVNRMQKLKVTFNNCYRDNTIANSQCGIEYIDGEKMLFGEVMHKENLMTFTMDQLLLGNCEGRATPNDKIMIEEVNEPTKYFTIGTLPPPYAILRVGIFFFPLLLP